MAGRPAPLRTVLDVALLAAVAALLLLVPAAALAVSGQPLPPGPAPPAPAMSAAGPDVRTLPTSRLPVRTLDDLRGDAGEALGADGADALIALLRSPSELQRENTGTAYPYRFGSMTALLDAAPGHGRTRAAGTLGARLMLLAGLGEPYYETMSAAAASYALLDRARGTGDCAAQLDLLLLVASDQTDAADRAAGETARAERACPGDPTPGWVRGQQLSQAMRHADAEAVFAALERRFPGSPGVVTGRADAHLRAGLDLLSRQPFTARHELRTAEAGYRRALAADRGSALPGLARTLIALGRGHEAAQLLDGSVHTDLLVTARESAREFAPPPRSPRSRPPPPARCSPHRCPTRRYRPAGPARATCRRTARSPGAPAPPGRPPWSCGSRRRAAAPTSTTSRSSPPSARTRPCSAPSPAAPSCAAPATRCSPDAPSSRDACVSRPGAPPPTRGTACCNPRRSPTWRASSSGRPSPVERSTRPPTRPPERPSTRRPTHGRTCGGGPGTCPAPKPPPEPG